MITAEPAVTPVTTPEPLMEATEALLLLQVPPDVAFESVVVPPTHTVLVPVIVPADGEGLTVTDCVAVAVPQLLVTV